TSLRPEKTRISSLGRPRAGFADHPVSVTWSPSETAASTDPPSPPRTIARRLPPIEIAPPPGGNAIAPPDRFAAGCARCDDPAGPAATPQILTGAPPATCTCHGVRAESAGSLRTCERP